MRIIITCKPDGTVASHIDGAVGSACDGVDDFLKTRWGKIKEVHTPEFFMTEKEDINEQQ